MTNPTLERAARALAFTSYKSEAEDYPDTFLEDYRGATPNELVEKFWQDWLPETRAVLMAVLPELKRYDPYEHHGSYEENQSENGPWAKYDDLTAILAEGE